MNSLKFPQKLIAVIMVICILAGCGAPMATPTLPPQLPTFTPPNTSLPPKLPTFTPPNTPLPPPTQAQPPQPTEHPTLFNFIRTVVVAPDGNFLTGGFARINYVPAEDQFVVTFGGQLAQPSGGCIDMGWSYKVYTTDMQATSESGTFTCGGGDSGSVMVDNTYYFVGMTKNGEQVGWHLLKIDAVSWTKLVDIFFPLNSPQEGDGDPMIEFVNGQLDISSGWTEAGGPPLPGEGGGTHHEFFSPDLQFLSKKILLDTPHITGSSLIYVDGIYYLVTGDAYTGDVVVMRYNNVWNYLGVKTLIQQGHWSTGIAYDGQRFYVAYLDTSQRTDPPFFPYYPNVHLAAFDRDWNLVDDVAVTNFTVSDNMMTGRPWVILHGNRLYVSYDVVTRDPDTHDDQLDKIQAIVSIYEVAPIP